MCDCVTDYNSANVTTTIGTHHKDQQNAIRDCKQQHTFTMCVLSETSTGSCNANATHKLVNIYTETGQCNSSSSSNI